MSTIDVIIFVPLVPLLVIGRLPWERWVFDKAPQKLLNLLGPYFLYAAFAFWHFKLGGWFVVFTVALAVFYSYVALLMKYIRAEQGNRGGLSP